MVSPISGIIVIFSTPSRSADDAIVGVFSILGNAASGKALPAAHFVAACSRLVNPELTLRRSGLSVQLWQWRQNTELRWPSRHSDSVVPHSLHSCPPRP